VRCPHCGTENDPARGSKYCRNCQLPLNRAELAPVADAEPAPRADVVAVPFLGGHIPCVEVDGEPMVILKPIAEDVMGLSWPRQYAKISADQSASVAFRAIQVPGDDQARKHMVVSLETFTVWLARLQPSRIKAEARDTVIAYQREAGRALRDHFFGQRIAEGDELDLLEVTTAKLARAIEIAKGERAARVEAEAEIEHMTPMVEAYEQTVEARGLIPMAVFAQQSGIVRPNGRPLGERTVIEALREIGVLKSAPGTEAHNTPYQQHAHRIVTRVERRGPTTANVPYVVPAHAVYLASRIGEHLHPGRVRLPRPRFGQLRAIEGSA
jgi:phage antirepressor YoqD-like protein